MRLTDDGAVVDGSVPIAELVLDGLEAPPIEGAETVGGYVLASLGRLAHPGDRIRLGTYMAIVEDVRKRRVHRVAVRLAGPDEDASPRASSPAPPDT